MFNPTHRRCSALTGALVATSLLPVLAASAGRVELKPTSAVSTPPGMVAFAHTPATGDQLVVLAENAKVTIIRDPGAADITFASACPRNWNVQGYMVRQAGFNIPRRGVAMMSDALGSRAIVNGKIYPLPNGQMNGLQMNKDGVFIGGQKVEPLEGSSIPGNAEGQDTLQVTVPDSFSGRLMLGAGPDSSVELSKWNGGSVQCTMVGSAKLNAGKLTGLEKAALDVRGDGSIRVGELTAKVVVANISGQGSVEIDQGSAAFSNATVSGTGKIRLHGKFNNLKQEVDGKGSIQVN